MSHENKNIYDLARKAIALMVLGYEPRKNESIEGFVSRCESDLKKNIALKDEEYAKSGA